MTSEEIVSVTIERFNSRGWGIAPFQGAQVEVIGGLPGDLLSVKLLKKRRGKWRADLLQVVSSSFLRVQPRCVHVPHCGGCTWQQMDYSAQLKEKQERVRLLFAPFLSDVECMDIVPCKDPWRYRNKMEFSFSCNRAGETFLGLILAGSRGHVFNLTQCHLSSLWYSTVLEQVRVWWKQSGLAAYRMNDTGALRTLVVRESRATGAKLVMLTVSGNPSYALHRSQLDSFVAAVKAATPEEQHPSLSIFLRVQQIHKGSPTQFFEMHLHGPDHLMEKMTLSLNKPVELAFKISPTSFFQPNTQQAERLYALGLQMVSFPKKHVLDLYAGTATLGMAAALYADQVTAIEINPHACFDAEANKQLNGLTNLEILCGDVGKKLAELQQRPDFIPPDLVVIDPPRAGLDANALTHLKTLLPEEILYISCNPETQALNIKDLLQFGYRLIKMQPVDQFPHTLHIENIALLKRA